MEEMNELMFVGMDFTKEPKRILDEKEHEICAYMSVDDKKAYNFGVDTVLSLIDAIVNSDPDETFVHLDGLKHQEEFTLEDLISKITEQNTDEEENEAMNITVETRDLFTVPQGYYLAHCISADFALGAGIAKKFDEVYNMRFKLFKNFDGYEYEGGDALLVDNVFNLVTKPRCFHKPYYEALEEALMSMKEQALVLDITKIAMPTLGCGLDKLEWTKVYSIIETVFADTNIEVLICAKP